MIGVIRIIYKLSIIYLFHLRYFMMNVRRKFGKLELKNTFAPCTLYIKRTDYIYVMYGVYDPITLVRYQIKYGAHSSDSM